MLNSLVTLLVASLTAFATSSDAFVVAPRSQLSAQSMATVRTTVTAQNVFGKNAPKEDLSFIETQDMTCEEVLYLNKQNEESMNIELQYDNSAHTMPTEHRKKGVASAEEIKEFIAAAGDQLLIADVRNPDSAVEPGDVKSIGLAPLPTPETRPLAKNLTFDREAKAMPLPDVPKDYYIITHCGAGSRGQEAKTFLEQHGFVNVLNGGGPKEKDLWEIYGDK